MAKLSEKRQRFVAEYLQDLNGAAAYRRAGYKAKTDHVAAVGAARLLTNADIAAAIAEAQAARAQRTELTQDWVIAQLRENIERAMQATRPTDKDGNPLGDYRWDGAVVNKACELLGKHLGMFKEEVARPPDMIQQVVIYIPDNGRDKNGAQKN